MVSSLTKASIFTFLYLIAFGCVPLQQQIIDDQNEKLSHYDPLELIISATKFQETLHPKFNETDLTSGNRQAKTTSELLEMNFQSGFSVVGYGDIQAGKLTRLYESRQGDPFQIIQNNLIFTIAYGGGMGSNGVAYDLIWNGKHNLTDDGLTVDLIISFKDVDIMRAMMYKRIRTDLTPLKTETTSEIILNILGYNEKIKYRY
jgi:hypothetical protein